MVVAGGFGPMLFAVLVRVTGNQAAASFYLSFAAGVSIVALVIGRRFDAYRREPLANSVSTGP